MDVVTAICSVVIMGYVLSSRLIGPGYRKVGPPGSSVITNKISWNTQQEPSEGLATLSAKCNSPEQISKQLVLNGYSWKHDYNIREFLAPNELVTKKGGVCSAFARFWVYQLGLLGIKADFVAVYSPKSAHAVTVFQDPTTGSYRMTSNQFLYKIDLGKDRHEAIKKAANQFYSNWLAIEIYGDDGLIREVINSLNSGIYPTIEEVDFDIKC